MMVFLYNMYSACIVHFLFKLNFLLVTQFACTQPVTIVAACMFVKCTHNLLLLLHNYTVKPV